MRTLAATILTLLALSIAARAEPAAPVLTLEEALRRALHQQPKLAKQRATIAVVEARVGTAAVRLGPQLSGTLGVSVGSTAGGFGTGQQTLTPGGVAAQYNVGLQASQLLWDFGRVGAQVAAARANVEAQRATLTQNEQNVAYAVRSAYFDAQAKQALVGVARESLGNQDRLVAQAKAGVDAGTRPEIDLAQLRSQQANAQVSLTQAEVDAAVALAVLRQSIGEDDDAPLAVTDTATPAVTKEDAPLETLLDEALAARPEFVTLARQLDAQEKTLAVANLGYMPSISATANTNHLGNTNNGVGGLNWNGGVSLSWPILQGGAVEASAAEARGNLELTRATVAEQRLAVRLDVEKAQRAVSVGLRVVAAAEVAVDAAKEQLRLADARWQAGVGNALELGNAQANAISAGFQLVNARQKLAQARASLLLALGRGIDGETAPAK